MTFQSKILAGGAVLLGALLLFLFLLVGSLDSIVERAIEHYGSEILGTRVRVGGVGIDLAEGKGRIRGLRIANPKDFGSGDAIAFGEITLELDVDSLSSQGPIIITLIDVTEPEVAYVIDSKRRNNLQAIQDNVAKHGSDDGTSGAAGDEAGPDRTSGEAKLAIQRLVIAEGTLAADLSALFMGRVETRLPPLRLDELGGRNGADPAKIASYIGAAFLRSALTAVTRSQIGAHVGEAIGGAKTGAKKMLENFMNQ
jgi:hypothetical protein